MRMSEELAYRLNKYLDEFIQFYIEKTRRGLRLFARITRLSEDDLKTYIEEQRKLPENERDRYGGLAQSVLYTKVKQETGDWKKAYEEVGSEFDLHYGGAFITADECRELEGAKFSGEKSAYGAKFSGKESAKEALFIGYGSGERAVFSGDHAGSSAEFSGRYAGVEAVFSGDSSAVAANFSGEKSGARAIFSGDNSGSFANFSGYCAGDEAEFSGKKTASYAEFSGDYAGRLANFSGDHAGSFAKFSGDHSGGSARFSGAHAGSFAEFSGRYAGSHAIFSSNYAGESVTIIRDPMVPYLHDEMHFELSVNEPEGHTENRYYIEIDITDSDEPYLNSEDEVE